MPVREMVKGKVFTYYPSMSAPKKFFLDQAKLIEFEEKIGPAAAKRERKKLVNGG